jgi:hypothetical protein
MVRTDAYYRSGADGLSYQINGDEIRARESEHRLDRHSGHRNQLIDREAPFGESFKNCTLVVEADFLIRVTPHTARVLRDGLAVDVGATKLQNLQAEVLDREKRQALIVDAFEWVVLNDIDRNPGSAPDDDRKIQSNAATGNDRAADIADLVNRWIERGLHEEVEAQRAGDRDGSRGFYASEVAPGGAWGTGLHMKARRLIDEGTAWRVGTRLSVAALFSSVMSLLQKVLRIPVEIELRGHFGESQDSKIVK